MKTVLIVITFALCVPAYGLTWSQEIAADDLDWGDAVKLCARMSMRLPSLDELKAAYKTGVTGAWKTAGYWSATEKAT